MQILDDAILVAFDVKADVHQFAQLAARKSCHAYGQGANLLGEFRRFYYIWRITGSRDDHYYITGIEQILELTRKYLLITQVIGNGRHEWNVVVERDATNQGLTYPLGSF